LSSVGILYLANTEAEVWLGFGNGIFYGCGYKHHVRYALGPSGIRPAGREALASTRPITLAGNMVAYETFYENPEVLERHLIVRDLGSGRVLHKAPTDSIKEPTFRRTAGASEAHSVVLTADGAVAWICGQVGGYQVRAIDKHGERVLAAGPEIAFESLSLSEPEFDYESFARIGSTVYWTQGGKPMSARLE